ncbi:MAG: hypothetical protein WCG84_01920 [Candidatus Moraniibacteriota bacterium]
MPKKIILSFLFLGILLAVSPTVQAVIVDSDQDGLSDSAEVQVYHTDPNKADTDGDSVPDGQEILEGTNPLDPNDSTIRTIDEQILATQTQFFDPDKLAWYIGRAAGIAAFILFTISIANGLLMSARVSIPSWPVFLSYEAHRTLSWSAFALLILHIISLTFDKFFHLSFAEALIPGWLHREFLSTLGINLTLAVGLGIIALYLIIIVSVTAEFRAKIAPVWWRKIHYASFLAYLIFLAHGIASGSDSKQWWMIWIYSLSATLVFGLTLVRITLALRKKSPQENSPIPEVTE